MDYFLHICKLPQVYYSTILVFLPSVPRRPRNAIANLAKSRSVSSLQAQWRIFAFSPANLTNLQGEYYRTELWVYWPYGPASSSSGLVSDTRSGTKSSGQQIVASQRRDCDHWSVTYTAADAADAAGAVCFEPRLYLHTVIAHGISSGFLLYLHLTAHIWDVMLVWRKWNINENCLCATVLCNNNGAQWYEQFLGPSTVSGFDLAWFSSLSPKRFCVFGLHGAI